MPRSLLIIDFSLSWRLSISKDSAVGFRQNFHLQYKTLTNNLKNVCMSTSNSLLPTICHVSFKLGKCAVGYHNKCSVLEWAVLAKSNFLLPVLSWSECCLTPGMSRFEHRCVVTLVAAATFLMKSPFFFPILVTNYVCQSYCLDEQISRKSQPQSARSTQACSGRAQSLSECILIAVLFANQ